MFKNMSKVTCTHWFEFFVRLILLIGLLISYLMNVHIFGVSLFGLLLVVFFGLYIYEFVVRLFPRQLGSNTSMGAKKYKFGPISFGDGSLDAIVDIRNRKYSRGRLFSVLFYLCVTGIACILLNYHYILSYKTLLILSSFYGVFDLICVLFYCPFQRVFIRNKCCNTCPIYNWDCMMIAFPLIPVVFMNVGLIRWISLIMILVALVVLILWELAYKRTPEKFSEETNMYLKCENCKEYSCKNKLRKL